MNKHNILININKIKLKIPRIISYLLLYGLFGVFNFIYLKNYVLLISIIVFAIIPWFSLIQLLILFNSLHIDLYASDNSITVGDVLGVGINISNSSFMSSLRLICDIDFANPYYSEKASQTFILPVRPKSTTSNPFSIKSNYCGIIQASIVKCVLYDILGLFYIEINSNNNISINVMPQPQPLSAVQQYGIITGFSDNEDDSKTGNEYSDTSNIREYIPGDRIKDIHWKLSSKKDEILVREHIRSCENKLMLWVDYSNIKKENEKIIQLVISICYYCLSEGILISLLWNSNTNNLINFPITNKKECLNAISDLYKTIRHDNGIPPKELLYASDIKSDKIIRVGRYNSEVNLYIYEL